MSETRIAEKKKHVLDKKITGTQSGIPIGTVVENPD